MKKTFLSLLFVLFIKFAFSQNVGIGTNSPHPSAALDITDTAKGILIPRMTMNQRNAIQNPAEGLMVYQTDSTKGFWYWNGSEWENVANTNSSNDKNNNNKTLIFTTSGF